MGTNFWSTPRVFQPTESSVGDVDFGDDGDGDSDGEADGDDGIESQRLDDIQMDVDTGATPLPECQNKRGRNKGKEGRKESAATKLSRQIDRLVGAVETHSSYSPTVSSGISSEIATCVVELETIFDITKVMNYTGWQ